MAIDFPAPMAGYRTTTGSDLLPAPGKVPVTAGHWHRESKEHPLKPKPRLTATPTGGRVARATGVAQYPRKRKTSKPAEMSAAQVHALWSKGKLDF